MKKSIPTIIILFLMALSIILAVAFIIRDGFSFDYILRCGLALLVCAVALVRIKTRNSGGLIPLSEIEKQNEKHIRTAFESDSKLREKLIRGIRHFVYSKYKNALHYLDPLLPACQTVDDFCAVQTFRALCFSRLGRVETAVAIYEEITRRDPGRSTVWSNLGMIYQTVLGKTDKAEAAYANAIKADPENPFCYNNLASMYVALGNYAAAIEPALRALELKSNMREASNTLYLAYSALGNSEKSKKFFEISVINGADPTELRAAGERLYAASRLQSEDAQLILPSEVSLAIESFSKRTALRMARIGIPREGNKSRFGGAALGDIPLDSSGKEMRLLCAIFLSEVKDIPDLPDHGILCFYIADNASYGHNPQTPAKQKDFRVIYYENEDIPEIAYASLASKHFPINGEYHIQFFPDICYLGATNYNFADEFDSELTLLGGERLYKYGASINRAVSNNFDAQGHRLGGYAHFNQSDIRRSNDAYRKYDRLLLQIDSHGELVRYGIDGTAKFFISSEALRSKDFSDILYVWDQP